MTVVRVSLRCLEHRASNELCDRPFKADVRWRRVAAAQRGFRTNARISQGALIVSSLTQRLVELCHLWMVPACRLGLMAAGGQERDTGTREAEDGNQELGTF